MNKKIMKTILLIVFVVFLGINKVNADTAKTCIYKFKTFATPDKWKNVTVKINGTYGVDVDGFSNSAVVNWTNKFEGFGGYDYFVNNNKECPPNAVITTNNVGLAAKFFFSDSNGRTDDIVASEADDHWFEIKQYRGVLSSSKGGAGQTGGGDPGSSTLIGCNCSGGSLSFSFKIDDDVSNPSVSVSKNNTKLASTKIENWDEPFSYNPWDIIGEDIRYDSSYTFLGKDFPKNSCPKYAIVATTKIGLFSDAPWMISLSDETDYSTIKDGMTDKYGVTADIHSLTCTEMTEAPKSNSNQISSEPSNIIDPTVNSNGHLDYDLTTYSCGNGMVTGIPKSIPKFGKFLYNFLQFLVPIALILLGTIDMIKSIVGAKEDDIKKNQQLFIKRLVIAAVVFFSFAIAKLLISVVAENSSNIIDCVDCVLRFSSSCVEER